MEKRARETEKKKGELYSESRERQWKTRPRELIWSFVRYKKIGLLKGHLY